MKNKLVLVLFAIIFVLISGCSKGPVTSDSSHVSEGVSSSPSESVALPTEAVNGYNEASGDGASSELPVGKELKKMVPDPYDIFSNKEIGYIKNTDEDDQQSFCITGVSKDDYRKYYKECRDDCGFTESVIDEDDYYIADHEGLPVRLELYYTSFEDTPEDNYILVVVKYVEG